MKSKALCVFLCALLLGNGLQATSKTSGPSKIHTAYAQPGWMIGGGIGTIFGVGSILATDHYARHANSPRSKKIWKALRVASIVLTALSATVGTGSVVARKMLPKEETTISLASLTPTMARMVNKFDPNATAVTPSQLARHLNRQRDITRAMEQQSPKKRFTQQQKSLETKFELLSISVTPGSLVQSGALPDTNPSAFSPAFHAWLQENPNPSPEFEFTSLEDQIATQSAILSNLKAHLAELDKVTLTPQERTTKTELELDCKNFEAHIVRLRKQQRYQSITCNLSEDGSFDGKKKA